MAQKFTLVSYRWMHIPTGTTGINDLELVGPDVRARLLELLDRWNAQQAGTWQYWSA